MVLTGDGVRYLLRDWDRLAARCLNECTLRFALTITFVIVGKSNLW
jgi:hypothetical protein